MVLATLILTLVGTTIAESLDEAVERSLNSGDTASAITRLQNEINTDPTYHYNYYVLGQIAFNRERWTEARDYFQTALDKKKKHYESLHYYGLSELKLGNLEGAEEAFHLIARDARAMIAHAGMHEAALEGERQVNALVVGLGGVLGGVVDQIEEDLLDGGCVRAHL